MHPELEVNGLEALLNIPAELSDETSELVEN
jgi:hypothetical protein